MENDPVFQYTKLLLDYVPFWSLILLGLIIWLARNPGVLKAIPTFVETAKIGQVEVKLREIEEKLEETESHVSELEEENTRLKQLYVAFDADAPAHELHETRQSLKALAGNLNDMTPVLEALKPGADPADVFAAAEILRQKRDLSAFDALVAAIDRIASSPNLEGLRYMTVWTLASALHRTLIVSVKHTNPPKISVEQLRNAKAALLKLRDNPHVQNDQPDDPDRGIRGPAKYALNWVETGLAKYGQAG